MESGYKPEGYNSVAPYLIVGDAARTIEFLKDALGAVELQRHASPRGGIMHAEVRIDDSVIMLADMAPDWPPVEAHVHVYVPDVDAAYRRAVEAGGTPVQEPAKKNDPDRRAGVRDAGGTTWWIATKVE